MQPLDSQYLTTHGYRTHFIESGDGDPLILIHGGGAGADCRGNWAGSIPLFAPSYRTIAYDMVGFGASDAPDPATFAYTQDARTEQLLALIEALGYRKVNLIGNSMGGCTALGVAMRRPDLLTNIVLMGSAGLSHSVTGAVSSILNYDFTMEGMRKVVSSLTHADFTPSEDMLRNRYELSVRPQTRASYAATMGWIKQRGGLYYEESQIARIKTRALIVNGKDDKVVPVQDAYRFLELLENSSGSILSHCGHWAMIEHPIQFAALTLQFLAGGQ